MWYRPMDEMAKDKAREALDRGHPQGLQHWARPKPRREPQSRVRADKGPVSIRIHSARLHHFLAKGMDLWSSLNRKCLCDLTELIKTSNIFLLKKEAHQESLIPSHWSPVCREPVPSSRTILMRSSERPCGTLQLRIIPRIKPSTNMILNVQQKY